jgi:hypothetical protein
MPRRRPVQIRADRLGRLSVSLGPFGPLRVSQFPGLSPHGRCVVARLEHSLTMTRDFPSDFYVTCATVIPVLFLALIVQGGAHESLLRTARLAGQRLPRRNRDLTITLIVPWISVITILCAITGEMLSLTALYLQQDLSIIAVVVILTTLELLFAVTTVPIVSLWQTDRAISRQRLSPVLREKDGPRFGYGAGARPLWTERDRDAEKIRIVLRDAGHREYGDWRDGFVVEGGNSEDPFFVGCTFADDADAAKERIGYLRGLNAAGYHVTADRNDERILQVRSKPQG